MGLDMYLRAQRYVSGWEFVEEAERNAFTSLVEMYGMSEFVTDASPHAYVEFCIGYWRKANQIHAWFVEQCQGGRDECQEAHVEIEKLKQLGSLCEQALASHSVGVARAKLPPKQGFFFGGYDIDEWYWDNLKSTVAIIEKAVKLYERPDEYWSFIYQSSW